MTVSSQQPGEGGVTMSILQMSEARLWGKLLKGAQKQGMEGFELRSLTPRCALSLQPYSGSQTHLFFTTSKFSGEI